MADSCRVFLCRRMYREVAEHGTANRQSTLAYRGEMRAARNECDRMAGARELRPVVPAHRPRSQNGKTHQSRSWRRVPSSGRTRLPQYQYAGSPSASSPRPAIDSAGRSSSVLATKASEPRMKISGTTG